MSAEFGNEIDLGRTPVGDFGQTTAPDPTKPKTDDLAVLIQRLNLSIDKVAKRQLSADKAKETIKAKNDADKFKKIALRLAEGRWNKANNDLLELKRQLKDLRETQHLRDVILHEKIKENEDLQDKLKEEKETKEEKKKFQEILQEEIDSVSEANEKFEKFTEDLAAPVKAITENNILLGSIAEDFGTIFKTISDSWSQLKGFANSVANLGLRGAKLADKFTSKSEEKSPDDTVKESKSEVSEVTPVEVSNLNESQRKEFESTHQEVPGHYSLKQAVADLKEANHIDAQKIIKSDKIQSVANTKSTNKYLKSIKNGVAQIRQSLIFRAVIESLKWSVVAAGVAAMAQILDTLKIFYDYKDEIVEAIKVGMGEIISPIKEVLNSFQFSIDKNFKSAGDSLLDTIAAKNNTLAESRYLNYKKSYDLERYRRLKSKDRVTYNEISSALKRSKDTQEQIAKLKAEGADWKTILAYQRSYINSLLDDPTLSVKARQYLSGQNYEDLQEPLEKATWEAGEMALGGESSKAEKNLSKVRQDQRKQDAKITGENLKSWQFEDDLYYPAFPKDGSRNVTAVLKGSEIKALTGDAYLNYDRTQGKKTRNEAYNAYKFKTEIAPIPPESKKSKKPKKPEKLAAVSTPPAASVNNVTNIIQGQNASIRPELGFLVT